MSLESRLKPKGESQRKPKLLFAPAFISKIDRRDYEYRMLETIRLNPDTNIYDLLAAQAYLSSQNETHLAYINKQADQVGPMDPECKLTICIPVASHEEGGNIYKTLLNYTKQTADKKSFEILLFLNRPDVNRQGEAVMPDETLAEVERFKKDYPDIKLSFMNEVIPLENAKIGYIRKCLADITLERLLRRVGSYSSHILVSNDADSKWISPLYIENFIEQFKLHKEIDSFAGQLDWDKEAYVKNPLIHVCTRLFLFIEAQLRRKNKNDIPTPGANFAFRAGIYAAVGGYSDIDAGEDTDLGNTIKAARMGAKTKQAVSFAGTKESRLYTSARRIEKALEQGLAPVEQWGLRFDVFNSNVRNMSENISKTKVDFDNSSYLEEFKTQLETIINRTLKVISLSKVDKKIIERAINWVGIKYDLHENGNITIKDISKLVTYLKDYAKHMNYD